MAKKLSRKKPGHTKTGEVKIVSLSYQQAHEMLGKTTKKKIAAKIRNRMRILEQRPGFINPIKEEIPTETVTE